MNTTIVGGHDSVSFFSEMHILTKARKRLTRYYLLAVNMIAGLETSKQILMW